MKLTIQKDEIYIATGGKAFDAQKPSVLFLHGSGSDHRTWALQTRWFAYHGYNALAPDFPGHSLSSGTALTQIEQSVDFIKTLLDTLSITQTHIVGHSQGVLSALAFAHQHNTSILSLSAIASATQIKVNPDLIETALHTPADAAQMMVKWGFGTHAHKGLSSIPGMQPMQICQNIMVANPLAIDLQACAEYQDGLTHSASLTCPSLCLLAEQDRMTPIRQGYALATAINAEITLIKNYGHMLPLEAPKQTLQAIQSFIRKVPVKA